MEHIDKAPYNCKECYGDLGIINFHRKGMNGPILKLSYTPPNPDVKWRHDKDKPIIYVECYTCQVEKRLVYTKPEVRAVIPVEGRDIPHGFDESSEQLRV